MKDKLNKLHGDKHKHRLSFEEETHTYYGNKVKVKQSVTAIISSLSPYKDNNIPKTILETAGVRGSLVHKGIEDFFNDVPDYNRVMLGIYEPYINAFKDGYDEYGDRYDILETELMLYSIEHKYSGTIDLIMYDKILKKICILDFKTVRTPSPQLVAAQMGGYNLLINGGNMCEVEMGLVLYLKDDGTYKLDFINLTKGLSVFKKLLGEKNEKNN